MTQKKYLLHILSIILPEIGQGRLKIKSYESPSDFSNLDKWILSDSVVETIVFIKGCTSQEKIVLLEHHSIEVKSLNCSWSEIFNADMLSKECQVITTFVSSQNPAIIFNSEKKLLYCLFDLEELVMRVSCLKDESGLKDRHGRFLAGYHTNKSRWEIPVLDIVGKMIREAFGFPVIKRKFGVVLTHDVDRVAVEPSLIIKNIIKKKRIERLFIKDEKDYLFHNLQTLIDIDSKYGINSVWFLLSGRYSLRRYGNRYNTNSSKVKKSIEAIASHGHSIGLHTSFYGAFDFQQILKEKKFLEGISGKTICLNRNHYLRFDIRKSIPNYEKCGFKADASMGYSDANGFRPGLCQPFHPWNFESDMTSKVLEIPLLYMDSVKSDKLLECWDDLSRILFWIKETKGCGTILFHPCTLANNKDQNELYKNFIGECQRLGIPFLCVNDVLNERQMI